jgi:hypothetical protein
MQLTVAAFRVTKQLLQFQTISEEADLAMHGTGRNVDVQRWLPR